jgi:hypothetical protein
MYICKFCKSARKNNNSLKNHELRCPSNPDRNYVSYTLGKTGWNKGLTKETDERVSQYAATIKESYINNPSLIRGCAAWTFEQRSKNAKKQGFGGYRENAGRSKKFKVIDSFGKETVLQSSYELRCYDILTELGIKWNRPKALKYDNRNYFADFYLPDFNLYLDPKNNFKAKLDMEKINKVIEQNNVRVVILLETQLTKEFIAGII